MKLILVVVFTVIAMTMNYAEARCVEGTTGGPCTTNGKPGIYRCLGGQGPVCVPSDEQPPKNMRAVAPGNRRECTRAIRTRYRDDRLAVRIRVPRGYSDGGER